MGFASGLLRSGRVCIGSGSGRIGFASGRLVSNGKVTSPCAGNLRGEDWALAVTVWKRLVSLASKARFVDQCVPFGVH